MIIDLPEYFARTDERGIKYVYIEDGILKLRNDVGFKALMKEIVYYKSENKCIYCGKKICRNQMTVDHSIPQDVGGPTITNNLVLSCNKCNSEKSNMSAIQYKHYLSEENLTKKREFFQEVQLKNEELKATKDFSFLNGWVTEMPINKIRGYKEVNKEDFLKNISNKKKKTKYEKIKDFYHKYGRLHKAIVVDRNNRLLGGFTSLMFCKNNHLKTVPVIKLENVEIFF